MRNPATPNAAQGIMAMVECLNMLKGAEGAICTGREMTKADAETWAAHMVNEDGTGLKEKLAAYYHGIVKAVE